jgi:hypothetical protein
MLGYRGPAVRTEIHRWICTVIFRPPSSAPDANGGEWRPGAGTLEPLLELENSEGILKKFGTGIRVGYPTFQRLEKISRVPKMRYDSFSGFWTRAIGHLVASRPFLERTVRLESLWRWSRNQIRDALPSLSDVLPEKQTLQRLISLVNSTPLNHRHPSDLPFPTPLVSHAFFLFQFIEASTRHDHFRVRRGALSPIIISHSVFHVRAQSFSNKEANLRSRLSRCTLPQC